MKKGLFFLQPSLKVYLTYICNFGITSFLTHICLTILAVAGMLGDLPRRTLDKNVNQELALPRNTSNKLWCFKYLQLKIESQQIKDWYIKNLWQGSSKQEALLSFVDTGRGQADGVT